MDENKKDIDKYYTIKRTERSEIKIKGSKFIASAAHISSRENADQYLKAIRSEFYDATHNCFAYRIGYDGLDFRWSDDGEPNGTAGKPILYSLKKFDFSDTIVIVTRYFGGVKLGVGPLARAYADASNEVLQLCLRETVHRTTPVKVFCTYEDVSVIKKLIDATAINYEEYYADAVEYLANVPLSKVESFCSQITSLTNARAGYVIVNN